MERVINRGDMYYADLDDQVKGSEQAGIRPVVILQNNTGNCYSATVIIAPITSKIHTKAKLPTHVLIKGNKNRLERKSLILTEQIRVIDKIRLKYYIGALDIAETRAVDKALIIALGLDYNQAKKEELRIKDKSLEKENKTEIVTRKQIAAYGVVAREYLKHTGNLGISNKLYCDYILTLMDLIKTDEIENKARKYIEE